MKHDRAYKGTRTRVSGRIPPDILVALHRETDRRNITVNDFVVEAIKEKLQWTKAPDPTAPPEAPSPSNNTDKAWPPSPSDSQAAPTPK